MSLETVAGIFIGALAAHVVIDIFLLIKKKIKKSRPTEIVKRSNVIQYDEMGYPLRLCIVKDGEEPARQVWLDTTVEEGDIELKWKKE